MSILITYKSIKTEFEKMQIFVRQLDGTTNLTEVNNLDALVGEFSDEQCYLAVGGVPLENEEQLSENCTVEMLARLPGG